ncbi:MAG: hypothetical protein QNL11_00180 [Desulfobacterales bacterium]|nr:hypothetical protein [Desulfobacterales bacterium]
MKIFEVHATLFYSLSQNNIPFQPQDNSVSSGKKRYIRQARLSPRDRIRYLVEKRIGLSEERAGWFF